MRCGWIENYKPNALMTAYHDEEWGRPFAGTDQQLFELLTLEIFQAGLSWETIINKRTNFKTAFANFDVKTVAQFDATDFERLMQDVGIVRNRLKIQATIANAQVILAMQATGKTFVDYMWSFTNGQVVQHNIQKMADIPAQDALSQQVAKQMKRDGFKFTGPVAIYSFLQGMGVINDHEVNCDFNPLKSA
jgi:DNA-3-methyladenine glycosylase I